MAEHVHRYDLDSVVDPRVAVDPVLLGYTLNVMTLGGLALAVGILVDDATVEIENIHRNLAQGKPIQRAILDGAQQIAVPAFVSTLAICIVFVSVVFSDWSGEISVHPAGARRRIRDARVVFALAHAGARDGQVSDSRSPRRKTAAKFLHADSTIIRETL